MRSLVPVAHLAGGKVPDDRIIDGRDIWPLMQGVPEAKSPHEAYILIHGGRAAVRSGKWKFYPWPEGSDRRRPKDAPKEPPKGPPVQLFDLSADLSETTNVAEQHPDVVARLRALVEAHREDLRENRRPAGRVEEAKRKP